MSYSEFVHHVAYKRLHPWGDDWQQAEAISATVVSSSPKFRQFDIRKFFPRPAKLVQQSADYIFGIFERHAVSARRTDGSVK